MRKDLSPIDDGMIHEFRVVGNVMMVLKNRGQHFNETDKGIRGYLAIENGTIENEGGERSNLALKNFKGKVVIVV